MLAKGKRLKNLNVKVATTLDYSIVGLTSLHIQQVARGQLCTSHLTRTAIRRLLYHCRALTWIFWVQSQYLMAFTTSDQTQLQQPRRNPVIQIYGDASATVSAFCAAVLFKVSKSSASDVHFLARRRMTCARYVTLTSWLNRTNWLEM